MRFRNLRRVLLALLCAGAAWWAFTLGAAADDDVPAPSKRIEVNLFTQTLTAWEGDTLVFTFPVTTGDEGSPTEMGEFAIMDKLPSAYSEIWKLELPYWMGIYEVGDYENGFHALPLTPDGEELWGEALGNYPATRGCIVLAPEDAALLFNWAEVGTSVVIYDGTPDAGQQTDSEAEMPSSAVSPEE